MRRCESCERTLNYGEDDNCNEYEDQDYHNNYDDDDDDEDDYYNY